MALRRRDWLAFGAWIVLAGAQFGLLPGTAHAWGIGLWRYLPAWASASLLVAGVVVCSSGVRARMRAVGSSVAHRIVRVPQPIALAVGTMLLVGTCWILRERHLSGDSPILLFALASGWTFVFPDVGATFLMGLALRMGRAVAGTSLGGVQLLSCLCAPIAVGALAGVASEVAPSRSRALIVALLLGGGLARIFAGHVEVYAPLLAGVATYLWLAIRCEREGRGLFTSGVVLGICIWIHVGAVCLGPSLVLLAHRRSRGVRGMVTTLGACALPMVLFAGSVVVMGDGSDVERTVRRVEQIMGQAEAVTPHMDRAWVRPPGSATSGGTDYALLDRRHTKYLLNAVHLLLPWLLPSLALLPLRRPRPAGGDGPITVLLTASVPLVLYALAARPIWGPYDWDMFSISALVLGTLAVALWARRLRLDDFHDAALLATSWTVLAVGLPFLAIAVFGGQGDGPFIPGAFALDLRAAHPFPEHLLPWL